MAKALDLTGKRFGKLVGVKRVGTDNHGKAIWRFVCDCGSSAEIRASDAKRGKTISCGCALTDEIRASNARAGASKIRDQKTKHGASLPGSQNYHAYAAWKTMHQRCENASNADFKSYGGRGIKVCERWRDFNLFLDDMGERPQGRYSLDRIDNKGNYEPSNCRWANDIEQANNRRQRGTGEMAQMKMVD